MSAIIVAIIILWLLLGAVTILLAQTYVDAAKYEERIQALEGMVEIITRANQSRIEYGICPDCHGSGVDEYKVNRCLWCGGTGKKALPSFKNQSSNTPKSPSE